jgi:hypothetical protein
MYSVVNNDFFKAKIGKIVLQELIVLAKKQGYNRSVTLKIKVA